MAEKIMTSSRQPGPAMGTGEKSKDLKKAVRELFSYIGRYRIAVILASCMAVCGAVLNLVGPGQLSKVTDIITEGLYGAMDMEKIIEIILLLVCLYLAGLAVNYIQAFIMATVTQRMTQSMRRDISEKINRLPLKYFDNTTVGDTLSRVTNDVDTVGQSMNQSFSMLVSSLAMLLGAAFVMFLTNWCMALCGIVASLVGFALMIGIIGRSQQYFARQQEEIGSLNGHIEETYSGHNIIRAYNAETESKDYFHKGNERLYECAWKSQFFASLMMPLMSFIGNLAYVVVCVVGAVFAMRGSITFGTIVAFMLYIRLFTQPLQTISQAASSLQSMAAARERVFEFLNEEEMPGESGKTEKLEKVHGDVTFSHVRFSYDKDHDIIHDFSKDVKAGQKLAIVGPTGAGKTTIVNLLMRFYEIQSGSISIDGIPIDSLRRENIHELFGMVLQDTWLFEGTLRENLVYGKAGVTDERIDEVCEACGLTSLVRQLPHGYDTVLGDTVNLSQGQKQLITIARAMIEDAPLLILDEATSSVDTLTEQKVQRAMDLLMQGRTSFVIAHRLSTIKNADCILVLKDGDIIESGTHDQLLLYRGFYADLYNSQFTTV